MLLGIDSLRVHNKIGGFYTGSAQVQSERLPCMNPWLCESDSGLVLGLIHCCLEVSENRGP